MLFILPCLPVYEENMKLKYYIKFWFPDRKFEDIMEFTETQMNISHTDPRITLLRNLHFQQTRRNRWYRSTDSAMAEIITKKVPDTCKKCGCEPELIWLDMYYFGCNDQYKVRCDNCDIETDAYFSENEALDEWERMQYKK